MNDIIIYQSPENPAQIEVRLEQETVWLNLNQIAQLFERDKSVISRHLKNVFSEGELLKEATVAFFATVQNESGRMVERNIEFFNLDAILSVGYRVNSKRGTQFRIWTSQILKSYLVQGFALNEKRLLEFHAGLADLERAVQFIQNAGKTGELNLPEVQGLLNVMGQYTRSFILLNRFDTHDLHSEPVSEEITYEITYEEAAAAVAELKRDLLARREATPLFANEKDDSFRGLLGNIVQTFGGRYLYPSIEEQAAHLLYFVIKNHPFSDGNKRSGAFLFVWFLEKNRHRFKISGELKINDNALVALTLLIAQSDPAEKDLMVKLIINLINAR